MSTKKGDSQPFIDFMLSEILQALQKTLKERVSDKVSDKVSDISASELSILRLLSNDKGLTQIALAEKSELSFGGVKRILTVLRRKGLIDRIGSNKTGHWIVNYKI